MPKWNKFLLNLLLKLIQTQCYQICNPIRRKSNSTLIYPGLRLIFHLFLPVHWSSSVQLYACIYWYLFYLFWAWIGHNLSVLFSVIFSENLWQSLKCLLNIHLQNKRICFTVLYNIISLTAFNNTLLKYVNRFKIALNM